MKFCEECGAQLEDDVMFCDECGAQIAEVAENVEAPNEPQPEPVVKPIKTKSVPKIYIVGGAVGIVLVAVIVVLVVMLLKKGNEQIPVVDADETTSIEGEIEHTTEESTTEEPTTEEPTDQESQTDDEKYKYLDDFVTLVGQISDWPSNMNEDEFDKYQKELYDEWTRGESFKEIVVGDDDKLYLDLFRGKPYGAYSITGSYEGIEFRFVIFKRYYEYTARYEEIYDSQSYEYVFGLDVDNIYLDKANYAHCYYNEINGGKLSFMISPYREDTCRFSVSKSEYMSGGYAYIDAIIKEGYESLVTFDTLDEYYNYFYSN